ncbi:hypothetical protein VB774_21120 [Pseudanabaena galeata UHCC 0370]|uniref:Uncharacterized protein n=1 Tax=Pseudanabaena galeata UHCC 0370 TaxID=3110310 RepID=A0ABU5TPN7_9CYAN|nr:hypothetical protein [Pseudanabaena galeata]MEA5480139.1 hypothetical protein [Pseudanabaena galeata UHCC 0370]
MTRIASLTGTSGLLYETTIRQKVETEENIGKMVIVDIETGSYEVDKTGVKAAHNLMQ